MSDERYENWVVVFTANTDYESDIVRDRLDDAGIPAVVLTQRDHAFNFTIGSMADSNVLVPPERRAEAEALLAGIPPTDDELNRAAMESDPAEGPAHDVGREAMLDSGIEKINLSPPEEDDVP